MTILVVTQVDEEVVAAAFFHADEVDVLDLIVASLKAILAVKKSISASIPPTIKLRFRARQPAVSFAVSKPKL